VIGNKKQAFVNDNIITFPSEYSSFRVGNNR